jgi:acyl dehydratase
MDDEFARSLGFPARVAHGLLGLALTDGLKNRAAVRIMAIASLGWSWRFRAPIFAGDRIGASVRVASAHLSRKGKGILALAFQVIKQDGTVVQEGETTLLVRRRTSDEGGSAQ